MKKWLGIGIAAALLSAWLAGPVAAGGTCFGTPDTNGYCQGLFVGVDTAKRGFVYLGDGSVRLYLWRSNSTTPTTYVGALLVSHDTTVESGLTNEQIRNGDVTLTDSMGVPLNTSSPSG